MKCQNMFSEQSRKKNMINLSSVELTQRVVKLITIDSTVLKLINRKQVLYKY